MQRTFFLYMNDSCALFPDIPEIFIQHVLSISQRTSTSNPGHWKSLKNSTNTLLMKTDLDVEDLIMVVRH